MARQRRETRSLARLCSRSLWFSIHRRRQTSDQRCNYLHTPTNVLGRVRSASNLIFFNCQRLRNSIIENVLTKGSRWTFQGNHMDGRVGDIVIKPDQFYFISTLMVMILLPIFERFVYPTFEKCGFSITLLRRLGIGCFLAAIGFSMSGILELQIEVLLI